MSAAGAAAGLGRPDLSFVIPTLNEEEHIGGVLDSIGRAIGGRLRYEVIVVDNGSRDRTLAIAEARGARCSRAPGCSISSLRNRGAARADAEILVFLDADVYLEQDWGERMVGVIERLRGDRCLLTGSLYGICSDGSWIERVWFAPRALNSQTSYINGGHLILHRSLFLISGGFDPEMETGEDCEFCLRAAGHGARIVNDPTLRVVHAGYPRTLRRFFGRERWHARGDYRSFDTLAVSKPGLISLANLCLAACCLAGLLLDRQRWFLYPPLYALFLAGVSLASATHRCRGAGGDGFAAVVLLYLVYFTARTVTLAEVILRRLLAPRRLARVGRA